MSDVAPETNPEPPVEVIVCNSWREFQASIRKDLPGFSLFRGHGDASWKLIAPSHRVDYEARKRMDEQPSNPLDASSGAGHWEEFRDHATGMPGPDITKLGDLELKALARHHGLASDMLDWTTSPYVAAFFAFANVAESAEAKYVENLGLKVDPGEVAIWRLTQAHEVARPEEFEILTALSSINYWQKAQAGRFTRIFRGRYVELSEYLDSIGLLDRLRKFTVPKSEVWKALQDLADMNITYDRLWPDFRGAALQANPGVVRSIMAGHGY